MMKRRTYLPSLFLLFPIFICALFFTFLTPAPVYACSTPTPDPLQTPEPTPTIQELTQTVELVLDGTITEILDGGGYIAEVKIVVQNYYKGNGPEEITATLTGWDCELNAGVGNRKIFFGRYISSTGFDLFLPPPSGAV